ncbi:MAG: glycosyltransferase [Thermomicrobiales bacterium]
MIAAAPPTEATGGSTPPTSYERLPARVLVTTPVAPPHDSGQAIVLDHLFRPVHPDDYRVLCLEMTNDRPVIAGTPLPGTTRRHQTWSMCYDAPTPVNLARRGRELATHVLQLAAVIAEIARAERCEVILATTGLLPSLPAAIAAGKITGIPVVLQMFDHWRLQSISPIDRMIANALEPRLCRAAAAVIVTNELLADALTRHTGLRPFVVRVPVADAALAPLPDVPWPARPDEITLLYSGQIYAAQEESLIRVAEAITEPGLEQARLHVYTHLPETITSMANRPGVVMHPFARHDEMLRLQREADILVLPLAFGGVYRDIIHTSSPTKFSEYLASGRPMLIHCPDHAFPAWYARRHRCGLVAGAQSSAAVAQAIRLLIRDATLRQTLSVAGPACARADFSIAASRQALCEALAAATGAPR